MTLLLDGQTTNTTGGQDTITVNPIAAHPDRLIFVEGSFASSTAVALEVKPSGASEWVSEEDFSAAATTVLAVPGTMEVRGAVTSAAASTSITMGIVEI